MDHRIDRFSGTEEEYVKYLEENLRLLRDHHRLCSPPQTGPLPEPSPEPPTPRWKLEAERLVEEAPEARCWWATMKKRGVYDAMRDGSAAKFLLDGNFASILPITNESSELTEANTSAEHYIAECIAAYAKNQAKNKTSALLYNMLSRFQNFIVLSCCAILRERGRPPDEIYNIVRICVQKDVQDRYCQRVMHAAIYINELIDMLNAHGWGHRACELFLIWNRTAGYYDRLASSPSESLSYFKEHLCTSKYIDVPQETPWTYFFVPGIIHHIVKRLIPVAKIGKILKYKHPYILEENDNLLNPFMYIEGIEGDVWHQ